MAPNINTDYESLWPVIASATLPPGLKPNIGVLSDPTSWIYAVKRECVNRAVYYNGPCPTAPSTTGTTAAAMIATGAAAIPVVGLGISAITSIIGSIFAHHAVAVKNEQDAECQVAQITAQAIPQIDAAVANGSITPAQGIAAHAQVVAQCKAIEAPVSGAGDSSHPCNAGCVFGYFLDALQQFAETYYMQLAPAPTVAVTPPATYAVTAPASVGTAQVDAAIPPPGSPVVSTVQNPSVVSPALAIAPASGAGALPSWSLFLIGAVGLGIVLLLARK